MNVRNQSFSVLRDHVNPHLQLASGVERSIRFQRPQCPADAGDRCWHTPGVDQSRTAYHHTNGPAEKNQTDLARPKEMGRDGRASGSRRRLGENAHIVWPCLMAIPLAIGVPLDGFGCDPVGGMQVDVISDPAGQDQHQNHRPGSCV